MTAQPQETPLKTNLPPQGFQYENVDIATPLSGATFDATLDYVGTLGQEYVGSGGWPAPGIGTYENTLATAEAMNRLGERAVDAGFTKFFGHNHDGEFRTTTTLACRFMRSCSVSRCSWHCRAK